jgi:hypothetical protein
LIKEHSAIQKMLDRQRNAGEIFVDEPDEKPPSNGKEQPKWVGFAANAPALAEQFIIPKLPNQAHAEWVRTFAGIAQMIAGFMGGNGAQPTVIDTTATVTPTLRDLPPALNEVIVRLPDPEAEALHRHAASLNPHAFAVFATKASAMRNIEERIAFVRGQMNGQPTAAGGMGAQARPPNTMPNHLADILMQTAAQLSDEDRAEFQRIVNSVEFAQLEPLAADLAKLAPEARAQGLRRGIAKIREQAAKAGTPPNGGSDPPKSGGASPPSGGGPQP